MKSCDFQCNRRIDRKSEVATGDFDKLERMAVMRNSVLTRAITFRVTEEAHRKIESVCTVTGETPTDWCRNASLEKLKIVSDEGLEMTPIERAIFEEVSRLRFLVGHAFRLVAVDKLTPNEWEKLRKESQENVAQIMKQLLPVGRTRGLSAVK